MALTNQQLTERIIAIETKLNDVQTALNNLATKAQLKSLASVRQSDILDLQARVTELETQIQILQS
jgi:predicted nuclease with TOPRIM domain